MCMAHHEVANNMSGTIPMNLGMAMTNFKYLFYTLLAYKCMNK